VARRVLARGARLAGFARPAIVNGDAGLVVALAGRTFAVVGFTIEDGRIAEIDVIANRSKLAHLDRR
jgi:RNA polymerase sigma-70 factor (ECF subfamily)